MTERPAPSSVRQAGRLDSFALPRERENLSERLVLIAGQSNLRLARDIADFLGMSLEEPVTRFQDDEPHIQIPTNLRNRNVVIIQSTSRPGGRHLNDLHLLADAVKRGSGKIITAVIPYFGFARQDRKVMPREPISAAKTARQLENSVHHIVTIDLHSPPVMGVFDGPWDNPSAATVFAPTVREWNTGKMVVVSPDVGGVKRADNFGKLVKARSLAAIYKSRDYSVENQSEALAIMGRVKGRDCVLVDDIVDGGGTLVSGANLLIRGGAASVRAVATHGVLTKGALKRIGDSPIEELLITDTIEQPKEVYENPKIRVLTVAPLLAAAIYGNETGMALSEMGLFS